MGRCGLVRCGKVKAMNSETLVVAGLSLGAAAVWGGGDFAGGIAAKRANVFRVVAGAHACGLVLMLLLASLFHEAIPPRVDLLWGVAAGLAGAFGISALYRALAIGRMGVVAPVAAVVTGILPVLVGLRLEGLPSPLQLAGFALALVSIWMVARPDGEIDTHRGIGLAVLAGISFGLFLVAGKQAGHHGVFWPMVAARSASTVLMLLIIAFLPGATNWQPTALIPTLLSGLGDSAGNALFIAATRHGRLDVAAVLSSLYPASTVLLAKFLLKERVSPLQNAGIAGALVSVALISAR